VGSLTESVDLILASRNLGGEQRSKAQRRLERLLWGLGQETASEEKTDNIRNREGMPLSTEYEKVRHS